MVDNFQTGTGNYFANRVLVHNCDLHARHSWLVGQKASLQARLEGDPDWCDAKVAGWWLWGICCWIGSGWCGGNGPWQSVDGRLVHLGNAGQGINRKLPHLGRGQGINRQLPHLGGGRGINRQLPHLGNPGQGVCDSWAAHLREMMTALSDRLRRVRVCCGDWSRVCGPSPTEHQGLTGVFLDPPYAHTERENGLYAVEMQTSDSVRDWAIAHGDSPLYRIALCGYEGEHEMPSGWTTYEWKARGGYGSQGNGTGRENSERERVWFSPQCRQPTVQGALELTEAASA